MRGHQLTRANYPDGSPRWKCIACGWTGFTPSSDCPGRKYERPGGSRNWRTHYCDLIAAAVVSGFDADPGTPDLDDEQPIHVRMTLGDYRKAVMVLASKEGS